MNMKLFATLLLAAAAAQAVAQPAVTPMEAPRLQATFDAWDANKDHQLSFDEFQAGWNAVRKAAEVQAALRKQFQSVDADKNVGIDAREYANLVLVKRAGNAAPPLSTFDTDQDQRLQFGEYVQMVRRLGATAQATTTGAGK